MAMLPGCLRSLRGYTRGKSLHIGILPFIGYSHSGYDHAVLIIHTHSADDTGDLWFCSHDADSGDPAVTQIGSVSIFLSIPINSHCCLVLQDHHRERYDAVYRGDKIFSIFPSRMWSSCQAGWGPHRSAGYGEEVFQPAAYQISPS